MMPYLVRGFVWIAALLALAVSESVALAAAPPCNLTPPPECAAQRDTNGYYAGVNQGMSFVLQIWKSKAVGENKDNWDILRTQVTSTIPAVVSSLRKVSWTPYTKCRVQGLVDGTVCKMNQLDPIPGCQLDGTDWGRISAELYCDLSIEMGGLGDVVPWYIRTPPGSCGQSWQNYCDDVYRYAATRGADDLLPEVRAFLVGQNIDPTQFWQEPKCLQYTLPPYVKVYDDSIYVDCSYIIPQQ
jgi:hypothetical protein